MLLAIDTATRQTSLALYDQSRVIAETSWETRANHTVELMPQIARMLDDARVDKKDLRAIAVSTGPGGFTGLRVGISVAKGLAWSLRVPLIGISALDALAHAFAEQPLVIWAMLVAGRNRLAVAKYFPTNHRVMRTGDLMLLDPTSLVELAASENARALFCGDLDRTLEENLRARLGDRAVIGSPAPNARRAALIAQLAWARLERAEFDDVSALAPIYLSQKI